MKDNIAKTSATSIRAKGNTDILHLHFVYDYIITANIKITNHNLAEPSLNPTPPVLL